jgi:uncharacterized membrane protein YeaQ/YmgE (transglycosylase-associated protein family)
MPSEVSNSAQFSPRRGRKLKPRWSTVPADEIDPHEPRAGQRPRETKMHLSGEGLLIILIVGLIAGWLAGQIVQGTGFGIVGDLLIGIVGALIGSWLLPQLGIHLGSGIIAAIINATIGALILLLILRLVRRGGGWRGSWGGWRRRW